VGGGGAVAGYGCEGAAVVGAVEGAWVLCEVEGEDDGAEEGRGADTGGAADGAGGCLTTRCKLYGREASATSGC
jgi:hypothetical protein